VSFEESLRYFHPWDSGMLLVGLFVVGMALWGVIAAPSQPDGARLWRLRFLRAAAALGILVLVIAGYHAVRAIGRYRDLGRFHTPKDFAESAIPAMEYAAIGCIGLLGLAAADLLAASASARGRTLPIVGVALLSVPFLPTVFAPPRNIDGFLPIPPLPWSAEWTAEGCLYGMLALGLVCLAAVARMAWKSGDPSVSERARSFGFRAGMAEIGIVVVFLLLHWTQVLTWRAMLGPRLTTTLWGDLYRSATGNVVVTCALLLGMAAVAMAGARREVGAEAGA